VKRTAHSIARIGTARVRDEHLQAANDPTCRAMERRAVAWMLVFCLVVAIAIVLERSPA
jgi:hypothetical protein